MFGRSVLSNADGSQNLVSVTDVLGSQTFYSAKYGIGDYAESFVQFNNNFYFLDPHNGTIVRGGFSGLDEIIEGRKIFFKDLIKGLTGEARAVYDLNRDAYIISLENELHYFKEDRGGWETVVPRDLDAMASINNRTYAFIDGEVYEFYEGAAMAAKIKTAVNEMPHETKVFGALRLESALPLTVRVTSHVGDATVSDYDKREDFYYGDLPMTEGSSNKYGLGEVQSVNGLNITLKKTPSSEMMIGDAVVAVNDDAVGNIVSVNGNVVTLDADAVGLSADDFLVGKKDALVSGDSVRGTVAILEIDFDAVDGHKLTAINVNASKSFN